MAGWESRIVTGKARMATFLASRVSILPRMATILASRVSVLPRMATILASRVSVLPRMATILASRGSILTRMETFLPSRVSILPRMATILASRVSILPRMATILPSRVSILRGRSVMDRRTCRDVPRPSTTPYRRPRGRRDVSASARSLRASQPLGGAQRRNTLPAGSPTQSDTSPPSFNPKHTSRHREPGTASKIADTPPGRSLSGGARPGSECIAPPRRHSTG